jgi:hypothetical protein
LRGASHRNPAGLALFTFLKAGTAGRWGTAAYLQGGSSDLMLTRTRKALSAGGQGPWILAAAVALGLLVTPFAVAAGDGGTIRGAARNPSSNQGQAYSSETQIIANNSTYGTRQSNKSDNGGGAIYGCRSGAGGTPKGNEPCIRANNLAQGRAFEFVTNGLEVGRIESTNSSAAPFTTNATGVATGLNADKVDGKSADDIVAAAQANNQFAAVDATGKLTSGRGAASATKTATGTYTVVFTNDVSKCVATATESTATDAGAVAVEVKDAKTLTVVTRAGGDDSTIGTKPADRPFNLLVTC